MNTYSSALKLVSTTIIFSNVFVFFSQFVSTNFFSFVFNKIIEGVTFWTIVSINHRLSRNGFWFRICSKIVFVWWFFIIIFCHNILCYLLLVIRKISFLRERIIKRVIKCRNLFYCSKKFWKKFVQRKSFVVLKWSFVSFIESFAVSIWSSQARSWFCKSSILFSADQIFILKIFSKFWSECFSFFDH